MAGRTAAFGARPFGKGAFGRLETATTDPIVDGRRIITVAADNRVITAPTYYRVITVPTYSRVIYSVEPRT